MTRREHFRQSRLSLGRICVDCGAPATVGHCCREHGLLGDARPMADLPRVCLSRVRSTAAQDIAHALFWLSHRIEMAPSSGRLMCAPRNATVAG